MVALRIRSTDGRRDRRPRVERGGALMPQLGLFPLEAVLLPAERVPLHIFEPRYQELIGECLEEEREFGFVFEDEDGVRQIGTRATVVEVLEHFDDGRLNILVAGGERFRIVSETDGRAFRTAEVEAVVDDDPASDRSLRARALELYRALGHMVEIEIDEPKPDSVALSFELAARVDFGSERKQDLLELGSERERLRTLISLLERASEAITLERAVADAAAKNGHGLRRD
jgi:Lon protease-like protein